MKKFFDFRVFALLLLVSLAILVVIQSKNRTEEEKTEILLPVTTMKPAFGDLKKFYTLNGYLESNDVVTVLPKVSGNLKELKLQVGDYVKKDQIIGVVDSEQLLLSTSQAETAYLNSKDTYERQALLYESKATSKQNYEQAKTIYEANKAQYELANLQLGYSKIKAPITGTILQVHSTEGALVSPGVPIITIGTLDDLIMKVNIPEKYYEYFYIQDNNMKIELLRPDYPYKTYNAKIRYISPVINPRTMSFEAVCDFSETPEMLRPGMFMKATFVLDEKKDIYFLPVECVNDNKAWYVDLETNRAHKIDITQGFVNDDFIQIQEDLKDLTFIKEGFYFLSENQEVNILEVQK